MTILLPIILGPRSLRQAMTVHFGCKGLHWRTFKRSLCLCGKLECYPAAYMSPVLLQDQLASWPLGLARGLSANKGGGGSLREWVVECRVFDDPNSILHSPVQHTSHVFSAHSVHMLQVGVMQMLVVCNSPYCCSSGSQPKPC